MLIIRETARSKILTGFILFVFGCLSSVSFFACKSATEDYPVIGKAADFTLFNQGKNTFNSTITGWLTTTNILIKIPPVMIVVINPERAG